MSGTRPGSSQAALLIFGHSALTGGNTIQQNGQFYLDEIAHFKQENYPLIFHNNRLVERWIVIEDTDNFHLTSFSIINRNLDIEVIINGYPKVFRRIHNNPQINTMYLLEHYLDGYTTIYW